MGLEKTSRKTKRENCAEAHSNVIQKTDRVDRDQVTDGRHMKLHNTRGQRGTQLPTRLKTYEDTKKRIGYGDYKPIRPLKHT